MREIRTYGSVGGLGGQPPRSTRKPLRRDRSFPSRSVPVRVCHSLSRLVSPNLVGRPTFPHPPIQVRRVVGHVLRLLTGSAPAPCPGGHATGPDFSTARRTVTSGGLRSPPSGPPPRLSLFVRARPAGAGPSCSPSPARGRGAGGRPPAKPAFVPQVAENA
jgi:hypothetical protein